MIMRLSRGKRKRKKKKKNAHGTFIVLSCLGRYGKIIIPIPYHLVTILDLRYGRSVPEPFLFLFLPCAVKVLDIMIRYHTTAV